MGHRPDGGLPVSVSPRHNQPASHTGRLAECFRMAHCAQPRQRRPRPASLPGRVRSHVTGPVRALPRAGSTHPGGTHPGGTRLLRSGAQAYLPAKGLRVCKEARVLACLLSRSERPSSMKPLERRVPVSWSVGSEDGAPTPLAGGTLVLLSCPSAGGRAERWWARQAQDQAPPLPQPEARW